MLRSIALAVSYLFSLSGCIVFGTPTHVPEKHPFPPAVLELIKLGESTKIDVRQLFASPGKDNRIGEPSEFRDGTVWQFGATRAMWQWWYCAFMGSGSYADGGCGVSDRGEQNYHLLVFFDAQDVVSTLEVMTGEQCVLSGFCYVGGRFVSLGKAFVASDDDLYLEDPTKADVIALLGPPTESYADNDYEEFLYLNPQRLLLSPLMAAPGVQTLGRGDYFALMVFERDRLTRISRGRKKVFKAHRAPPELRNIITAAFSVTPDQMKFVQGAFSSEITQGCRGSEKFLTVASTNPGVFIHAADFVGTALFTEEGYVEVRTYPINTLKSIERQNYYFSSCVVLYFQTKTLTVLMMDDKADKLIVQNLQQIIDKRLQQEDEHHLMP